MRCFDSPVPPAVRGIRSLVAHEDVGADASPWVENDWRLLGAGRVRSNHRPLHCQCCTHFPWPATTRVLVERVSCSSPGGFGHEAWFNLFVASRLPSNVVLMGGMGEQLANDHQIWEAVERICGDLGLSALQVTISTVGVVPATCRQLAG